MATNTGEITSEMLDYGAQNSADLLTLAYQSMDVWQDVTVLPDVKNKIKLSTLEVDNIVKPFKADFSPAANKFRFNPREIGVQVAKADLQLVPEDYRQTYLGEFMQKGVARSPEDIPFARYVWEALFEHFGQELNNITAYFGDHDANGTDAIDVADGYGKILAALITAGDTGGVESVGALDSVNAIEQLTQMWRAIPEVFRRSKKWKWQAYMSQSSYDCHEDAMDNKNWNMGGGNGYLGSKFLRKTDNMLALKPVSWMGGSDRVIITPKSNIIVAADATTQDLAKMNVVQDVWFAKIGIAAALGFDFRYGPLIWSNEVQ